MHKLFAIFLPIAAVLGTVGGILNLDNFGMDTVTLAGTLKSKLLAVRQANFSQIMLSSNDLVDYPGGLEAAVALVRDSGLRVTGLQVMRDYEGLEGILHDHKVDVAKNMLQICQAVGAPFLLVCSSVSPHASGDKGHIAQDLAKFADTAALLDIRVGFEALSWGRHISKYMQAWEVVSMADRANLGIVIDTFHILANNESLNELEDIPSCRIALVQLADFMWSEIRTLEEKLETARHMRTFPGKGKHSLEVLNIVRRLHDGGYCGDYSFEVFNDDYKQMELRVVTELARSSAKWVQRGITTTN